MKRILFLLSFCIVTACSVGGVKADPAVSATNGTVTITANARLVDNMPKSEYTIASDLSASVPVESTHRFICEVTVSGTHDLVWYCYSKIAVTKDDFGEDIVTVDPDNPWDISDYLSHTENLTQGYYTAQAHSDLYCDDDLDVGAGESHSVYVHF